MKLNINLGRCRRLYDIANVLVAMGLIKKVHYLFGTKKIPLFVYCGPEPACKSIIQDIRTLNFIATATEARASMMEFVKRSGLAQLNDSTWTAIFGAPTTSFRSVENFQTMQTHQFNGVQKSAQHKEPKRRVFGELDPINPLGRSLNSSTNVDQSTKPFKKRNFDGSFKHPGPLTIKIEDKENLTFSSNDENALPKPQPQVSIKIVAHSQTFLFRMPLPPQHNSKAKVWTR
jgi:hypothetical protein